MSKLSGLPTLGGSAQKWTFSCDFFLAWPILAEVDFTRTFTNISPNLLTHKYILSAYKPLCKNLPEISFKLYNVEDLQLNRDT